MYTSVKNLTYYFLYRYDFFGASLFLYPTIFQYAAHTSFILLMRPFLLLSEHGCRFTVAWIYPPLLDFIFYMFLFGTSCYVPTSSCNSSNTLHCHRGSSSNYQTVSGLSFSFRRSAGLKKVSHLLLTASVNFSTFLRTYHSFCWVSTRFLFLWVLISSSLTFLLASRVLASRSNF